MPKKIILLNKWSFARSLMFKFAMAQALKVATDNMKTNVDQVVN
jgi:hypothetical protein